MGKFKLGQVVATPGALEELTRGEIASALNRHASGDWGELCKEDKRENELALKERFRILSAYMSSRGKKFWVITEADRSSTTVLMPDEY